jgi:hypothetical protein
MGKVQILITFPRWSCLKVSAIEPDPTVRGHEPAVPARNRKTISIDRFVDRPQARVKTMKRKVLRWYT